MTSPGMNLSHPDSPDVIQALETRCRHCGVEIEFLENLNQWWHIVGAKQRVAFRACRDKTTWKLIGDHLAEPEEKS